MSDQCGQADKIIEMNLNVGIMTARNYKREVDPCGFCHNCHEFVDYPSQLFCDSECSEDYEKRNRP